MVCMVMIRFCSFPNLLHFLFCRLHSHRFLSEPREKSRFGRFSIKIDTKKQKFDHAFRRKCLVVGCWARCFCCWETDEIQLVSLVLWTQRFQFWFEILSGMLWFLRNLIFEERSLWFWPNWCRRLWTIHHERPVVSSTQCPCWVLEKLLSLDIRVFKTKPLAWSSCLQSPTNTARFRKSFFTALRCSCILVFLYPCSKNWEPPYNHSVKSDRVVFDRPSLPLKLRDIPKFETNNSLSVIVFSLDGEGSLFCSHWRKLKRQSPRSLLVTTHWWVEFFLLFDKQCSKFLAKIMSLSWKSRKKPNRKHFCGLYALNRKNWICGSCLVVWRQSTSNNRDAYWVVEIEVCQLGENPKVSVCCLHRFAGPQCSSKCCGREKYSNHCTSIAGYLWAHSSGCLN